MADRCIKAIISGRVQGVFFRQSTKEQAQALGLTGHAINLANGDVEVIACGTNAAIAELTKWLKHGPVMANVTNLSIATTDISAPLAFTVG
jgi:acylphosphatase